MTFDPNSLLENLTDPDPSTGVHGHLYAPDNADTDFRAERNAWRDRAHELGEEVRLLRGVKSF